MTDIIKYSVDFQKNCNEVRLGLDDCLGTSLETATSLETTIWLWIIKV